MNSLVSLKLAFELYFHSRELPLSPSPFELQFLHQRPTSFSELGGRNVHQLQGEFTHLPQGNSHCFLVGVRRRSSASAGQPKQKTVQ